MDGKIATKTLGDIYLSQGNSRKALQIYHEVLKREPSNPEIIEAIQRLKGLAPQDTRVVDTTPVPGLSREEKLQNLKRWQRMIEMIQRQRRDKVTP